ncbi:LPXTG cell wall anchor domain-containing protein [Gemella morbillorum]
MKNKNFIIKIVMLVLILGGILGLSTNNVQAVPEEGNTIYLDNAGGNDANNGESEATAVKTFNKALELLGENGTLKVKSFDKQSGIVFNKKGTLEIIEDTTLQGNRTDIGITMKSGSHLRMAEGKTLKMKDFKTALTIENGAELNDGNYILENNASDRYGKGLNIIGAVKGSSGRDKLVLKANDIYNVNFYSGTATFENATIEVISQTRVWSDAKKLTMTNTSMTLSGYGQGFYIDGGSQIIDSYLYMKEPRGYFYNTNSTGMTFQGTGSTISGSTLRADYGSNAGISIGLSNANQILSMTNSTLEFNNSGQGGLNVNTGIVELAGTTIKTNERQRGALYGAQTNAKLIFNADTVVDSAANKDADNGLGQTNDNYVVIGGSHHVKYAPDYKPGGAAAGVAIPTNGVNNGNEKLRLFTLTDSTVTSLNPLNKNNTTYLYSIVKASADGKKYAWLPEVNVTFKLNAPDAKFQDNTSNDKVLRTYRGGKLSEVEGNDIPKDPTREGYTFLGWKLKDSTDSFNTDVAVKEDLIYEAKWDKNPTPKNFEGTLPGDILIGDDTGHDKLHEEKAGAEIEYTGKIGVASIKNHIQTLANNYGGDINTITLNDIESTFTTKIALENGLDISNVTNATFTNNNLFEIKEFSKSGNEITVKFGLKKQYTKFTDLLNDVNSVPDVLDVKVPKVKVKDNLANGTKLKVVGTVEGTFKGFAKTASGNREQYDFKWTAEQEPSGKDIEQTAGDDTTIQYTILVKEKDAKLVQYNGVLPGDILIGDDTGHDKLHEEKAGNEIEYTGKIGVASIKDHIQRLANNYGGDINTITLNDIESTFTTKIALENGLDISNVTEAIFTDNNLFEIKEFSKSGNVVTVKYGLKKNYTKFTDLLTDVTNVPDVLEIKLPKVKVKDDLANGTKLKVVGTVEGTFKGFAKTASGNREQYDFKWTAEQVPSGIDIEQAAGDTTTIQYTVLVIKQVTPPLPEPTPGEKTVNSENGNEGATVRQLTEKGEVFRYDIKTKLEENSNHHNQFSISDTLDSVLQINKVAIKIDGAELDEDMVLPEYTQLKNKLQEVTKKLEELAALEEKVNKLKSDVDKLETEYAAFPDKTVEEAKAVKIKLDNVKSELTIAKTKFEADKVNKPNLEKIVNDTKVEIEAFEKTDKFKLIRIINQALNSRNEKNEISDDFVKKLGHLEIKGNTVEYLIDSPIILKQLDGRQITLSIYANILSGANLEKYIDKQHKVIKIANKAIITNNNVAKETNVVYVTLRAKDKPIIPNKPNKPNKPKKLPNTGKATADVAGLGLVGVTLAYLLARRKFNK